MVATSRAARDELLCDLLAACGREDRQAFARLYRLTSPKLYAVLLRILRQEAAAQDVLQEVYISVWRRAGHYHFDRGAPLTWLISIARNRTLDRLRRDRHERRADPDPERRLAATVDEAADVEGELSGSEEARVLRECMEHLSEQQRWSLRLAFFEGLTHAELAERLQVPLGSVKTWIRRGMMAVRRCLDGRI